MPKGKKTLQPTSEHAAQSKELTVAEKIARTFQKATNEIIEERGPELEALWTPRNAEELYRCELLLLTIVLAIAGKVIAIILKRLANNRFIRKLCVANFRSTQKDEWETVNCEPVQIQTRFGNWLKFRSPLLVPKGERAPKRKRKGQKTKKIGRRPVLEYLGLEHRCTPLLMADVSREVAEGPSYGAVKERFAMQGINLSKSRLRRIFKLFSDKAMAFREKMLSGEVANFFPQVRGWKVIVQVDGGRLKESKKKKGRLKKGAKRHGRHTGWREPCEFMIKLVSPDGTEYKIYDGTMKNWSRTFRFLERYLRMLRIEEAAEIEFIADGAPHIWTGSYAMFERMGLLDRVHFTLDFYHAAGKIWEIANEIKSWKSDNHRKAWARTMITLMKTGQLDELYEAIKCYCRGRKAKVISRHLKYLVDHREHLQYAKMEALGLSKGSGEIESAIRRVVNLRIKGNGIFWTEPMAEKMLFLRSYLKAGWWEKLVTGIWSSCQGGTH